MMKRINVYLDEDLWHAFRTKCLAHRRSASKALSALLAQDLEDAVLRGQRCDQERPSFFVWEDLDDQDKAHGQE
jgi:hypothetical protein